MIKKITFLLIIIISLPLYAQRQVTNVIDLQQNQVSNISFYSTNNGIIGFDSKNIKPGLFWPRGSQNQYMFGGGYWFAAQKRINDTTLTNLVEVSYNPQKGNSWFVPGRIADCDSLILTDNWRYQSYFSTDYNLDGTPKEKNNSYNWPIWIDYSIKRDESQWIQFGDYIPKNEKRIPSAKMDLLFNSGEDIVSIYKDTDLRHFDDGVVYRKSLGYPLGLEVIQKISSFSNPNLKDAIILNYKIYNKSKDTLFNCVFLPIYDVAISIRDSSKGYINDHQSYYFPDTSLNLVYAYTDGNEGENGKGFGYMGVAVLKSPVINNDSNNKKEYRFLSKNQSLTQRHSQIGLASCLNYSSQNKKETTKYLNNKIKEGDSGPTHIGMLLQIGYFNMKPLDSIEIALIMAFAMPAKGGEADGTEEDLLNLVNLVSDISNRYYNPLKSVEDNLSSSNNEIFIISNPTENFINLKLQNDIESGEIVIFDYLGQEVLTQKISSYSKSIQIDVSQLPNGIYFLTLQNGLRVTSNKFIIVK